MLEKIPSLIGNALKGVRPGIEKTLAHTTFADVPETIAVDSPAFGHGAAMPQDGTADGQGLSPALTWSNLPGGTVEIVLVMEDADSPTPAPLVHAIVYGLHPSGDLPAGAMGQEAGGPAMGLNSFGKAGYLPPDPPSGHGAHRYVIQVYALGRSAGLTGQPGRGAVVDALEGKVSAKGVLIGTYERP